MVITATIRNGLKENDIVVATEGNTKSITIPGKFEGRGSSVNGGELLFLSLATCFCNDIYREAARRKMHIDLVTVDVAGEFGKEGEPASNITYSVKIDASASTQQEIEDLVNHVDKVAEVHNTLRKGVNVSLKS
jgi:organic hydroperoxide reductase OsmC/OhrA